MSLPLRTPRQIPCPQCRAGANHSCKRAIKGGVRVEFMKGFHAPRRAEFNRITEANPDATTDPATWTDAS